MLLVLLEPSSKSSTPSRCVCSTSVHAKPARAPLAAGPGLASLIPLHVTLSPWPVTIDICRGEVTYFYCKCSSQPARQPTELLHYIIIRELAQPASQPRDRLILSKS